MSEESLPFGPVLLASLASSPLPVSNLTDLIGTQRWGLTSAQFATHLGSPTLVAVIVAWPLMARVVPTWTSSPRLTTHESSIAGGRLIETLSVWDRRSFVHLPSGSR